MQSEALGEAGEAGWDPEVEEGQGTAVLVTQALRRRMIQGALMRDLCSPSLKMMTGTENQGLLQVSPPGLTLRAAESRRLFDIQGMPHTSYFSQCCNFLRGHYIDFKEAYEVVNHQANISSIMG